jgi:hypothetical protein
MKRKVNKSALVREALKAHPDKGNKELAKIIGKGVTTQTIANVKGLMKTKGKSKTETKERNGTLSVADLMKVNQLVQDIGGITVVREGLDVLSELKY